MVGFRNLSPSRGEALGEWMESRSAGRDRFPPMGPPNGGDCKGNSPAISGKSRLVKYYFIWPDSVLILFGGRGIYENHI